MTNIHDYLNGMAAMAGKDAIDNAKQKDLYEYNMDYRRFYDNCRRPEVNLPQLPVLPIVLPEFRLPEIPVLPTFLPKIDIPELPKIDWKKQGF